MGDRTHVCQWISYDATTDRFFFGRMTLKIRQCVANQLHSNLALAADVKGKIMTMIVKGISFLGSVLNIIRLL